jgi:hypothetical protein
MTHEVSKNGFHFKGCLLSWLKMIVWIVIPAFIAILAFDFVKEKAAKDELAKLLIPLHNDYVMFEQYYMTIESWQNGWILRLLIFTFPPFFFLFLVFGIVNSFVKDSKSITYTIRILMSVMLLWGVGKAFFLPKVFTNFDTEAKQIVYQRYNFFGLKTEKIDFPFNAIDSITYNIERKVWRNEVFEYVRIYVHSSPHSKLLIGIEPLESVTLNYPKMEEYLKTSLPQKYINRGEAIILALYKIMGREDEMLNKLLPSLQLPQ